MILKDTTIEENEVLELFIEIDPPPLIVRLGPPMRNGASEPGPIWISPAL